MKSDIEIAREANMQPIQTVAEKLSITADELDLYGMEASSDIKEKKAS